MYGDRVRTKKEIKTRKAGTGKVVKTVVVIVVVLLVVAGIVAAVFSIAKPFEIRKIVCESADDGFEADVMPYAEKYIGTDGLAAIVKSNGLRGVLATLKGRYTAAERDISFEFPQYKNVRVKLSGSTLHISGEPRGAYVIVTEAGEAVVTDRAGVVALICELDRLSEDSVGMQGIEVDGPAVSGLSVTQSDLGSRIKYANEIAWSDVVEFYYAVLADDTLYSRVRLIYFAGKDEAYFYCTDNVVVKFGKLGDGSTNCARLERLAAIFRSGKVELKDGTITLSDSGNDVFSRNATPEPPETEAPTEEPTETPTAAPPVTERPTETPTEVPAVTEAPEETEVPENTEAPEETEIPENTEEPEPTETPAEETESPPEETENPEEPTEEPTPEETEEPSPTEIPEETEKPSEEPSGETEEPGENTPEPTGTPEEEATAEPSGEGGGEEGEGELD
ncbi:MAG: hypothetical protein J5912_02755 [Clostridia bacterium]|nr:hypothetical protein [Clostridia bacterium]